MLEMTDFFQRQAQECRILAARARHKNDREYWLHLAQRWEWMGQQNVTAKVKTARAIPLNEFAVPTKIIRIIVECMTPRP